MKTRKIFFVVVITILAMSFLGIPQPALSQDAKMKLKIVDSQIRESPYGIEINEFAKRITARTNGRIEMTAFTGTQYGSEAQILEGVRLGAFAIGQAGVTGYPELNLVWMPYVFRDKEHLWKTLYGPVGKKWSDKMAKDWGTRILGFSWYGPRQMTTNRPIHKIQDLAGLKIRVPENPVMIATWKALGASPTPVAWPEVFMALQSKTVDAQENPLQLIYDSVFWEVQKYLIFTSHVLGPRNAIISDRLWQSLSAEDQNLFSTTWMEVSDELYKQYIVDDQKRLEKMQANGMTVIRPDIEPFRKATANVWKDFAPKVWGEGVYEQIQAIK
jgi:TRAP-type transport system periplasmic protein